MNARSEWFVTHGAAAGQPARIFCFPHAGGGSHSLLAWQGALRDDAQLLAVCRPGREHRVDEPAPTFDEYVDGAAAAIRAAADGRPMYLFGHSLGALVAFEVARQLADLPDLRHLVASGCSAPELLPSKRVRAIAELEGREFAEAICFFGGLTPEVAADEDVRALLLPGLIADFRMAVGYEYRPSARLTVPLSLINGRQDPHIGPAQLVPWRHESAAPVHHWADGGHFYFERQPDAVTDVLREMILADQHVEVI